MDEYGWDGRCIPESSVITADARVLLYRLCTYTTARPTMPHNSLCKATERMGRDVNEPAAICSIALFQPLTDKVDP